MIFRKIRTYERSRKQAATARKWWFFKKDRKPFPRARGLVDRDALD